jgi:hypothetical protein
MAQTPTNLGNEIQEVLTTLDSVVIIENLETIRGGRSLDLTGYTPQGYNPTVLRAGHLIIADNSGNFKPMPLVAEIEELNEEEVPTGNYIYGTLPSNHTYAGILVATITTKRPLAAIMVRGTVNKAAAPYPFDNTLITAVKAALPTILFRED